MSPTSLTPVLDAMAPRCIECNKIIPKWVITDSQLLGFKVEVCSARCSVALAARRQRQR